MVSRRTGFIKRRSLQRYDEMPGAVREDQRLLVVRERTRPYGEALRCHHPRERVSVCVEDENYAIVGKGKPYMCKSELAVGQMIFPCDRERKHHGKHMCHVVMGPRHRRMRVRMDWKADEAAKRMR